MENVTGEINITEFNTTQQVPRFRTLTVEMLDTLWKLYRVAVPAMFTTVSIVGVIGNILVLVVCAKNKSMKTLNNSLIRLLAVADLLFLCLCVPTTAIVYSVPIWPFGVVGCKVLHYLIYVSSYFNIYLMCLMSFERFCALVLPLKRLGIGSNKYLLYIGISILLFCLIINVPALFIYDILYSFNVWGERTEVCYYNDNVLVTSTYSLSNVFFMNFGIFVYVIPILFIIIAYTAIFYKLVTKKKIRSTSASNSHIRAAKIVLVLEIAFFICYTPIQAMFIFDKFTGMFSNYDTYVLMCAVYVAGNVLSYTNSCINPILYTFVSSEYRVTLASLWKKKGDIVTKPQK